MSHLLLQLVVLVLYLDVLVFVNELLSLLGFSEKMVYLLCIIELILLSHIIKLFSHLLHKILHLLIHFVSAFQGTLFLHLLGIFLEIFQGLSHFHSFKEFLGFLQRLLSKFLYFVQSKYLVLFVVSENDT